VLLRATRAVRPVGLRRGGATGSRGRSVRARSGRSASSRGAVRAGSCRGVSLGVMGRAASG